MSQSTAILLAIQHRDKKSLPANRGPNGIDAFHWMLLLAPTGQNIGADHCLTIGGSQRSQYLDVSDVPVDEMNPDGSLKDGHLDIGHEWYFRRSLVDPLQDQRLVLMAKVGDMEGSPTDELIDQIQKGCPVPTVGGGGNCMTWVRSAIVLLKGMEVIDAQVDVENAFVETRREGLRRYDAGLFVEMRPNVFDLGRKT